MKIHLIPGQYFSSSARVSRFVELVTTRPLVTSGACLTLAGFLTSISKNTIKLSPIFGIPGIILLIYQILFPCDQTNQSNSSNRGLIKYESSCEV